AWNALYKKHSADFTLISKRHDMAENIKRFTDVTGINDDEIRQNMIISTYSGILSNGALLPDAVFEEDIKDFSSVAVSFLTEQNNVLKRVLAKAVSNVSQMSPDDDGDKIILNLVEKHRGKMIFIDIWNTWCGACLAAMADHEQEKGDYTDKVAFVYLADETSPEERWNERIKAFTGDHYRLPLDQHQSLMQRFNFQGYPSYIIISSNGDIVSTTNHIHSLSELDEWLK
ncbi:MAG: TlpA family protein disulfide reductase, partial [Muribaculaceae bacterium]|nr:TlpA family protein disulfide reductase [Muribaculaceae bacterium]